jgi:Bacterial nucleoid DNA-binding protein
MTKTELIDALAKETGFNRKDGEAFLNAYIKLTKEALKQGDEIKLVGFGTFKVTERAARTGRNPKSGETIHIKAAKVPTFKAGKEFKDALN